VIRKPYLAAVAIVATGLPAHAFENVFLPAEEIPMRSKRPTNRSSSARYGATGL